MIADIRVYCDKRLKQIASDMADREQIPLSELVVRALAAYTSAPEELATIPRKSPGRPRKPISLAS